MLVFFYGKKVYDKVRKRRIYEIDDNYKYNAKEEKASANLEMMLNFKK